MASILTMNTVSFEPKLTFTISRALCHPSLHPLSHPVPAHLILQRRPQIVNSLPLHQDIALECTSSYLIITLPQRHSITPGMNKDCGPRMPNECGMAVLAVDSPDVLCLGTASGSMPSVV